MTEDEIICAVKNGATNLKDIRNACSANTGNLCEELNPKGCSCADDILKIIASHRIKCSCGCRNSN